MATKLMAKTVATMPPGYHAAGQGLYLQVTQAGSRSWLYRYQRAGRRHEMGLGSARFVSLAEARKLANECRYLLFQGIDPLARKRAGQAPKLPTMTFAEAAEACFEANKAQWVQRHAKLWLSSMRQHAFPVIGKLPVADVDLPAVLRVLEPLWHDKTDTASRLRARIEQTIDWATVRGHRSGDNPAIWKGRLEAVLPSPKRIKTVERFAALPYREIPAFMADLRQRDGIAYRALDFLILTAARTGEILGAEWQEIDMAERIWTMPATRTKTRTEHRVPLSDAAMTAIDPLWQHRSGPFVFGTGNRPPNQNALRRALQRLRDDVDVHGFRSSFRDWAQEQTAFPEIVAEMALGHQVGSAVERAYRRSDLFAQRRRLMDMWAEFCSAPAGGGENVVPIRT